MLVHYDLSENNLDVTMILIEDVREDQSQLSYKMLLAI